MISKRDQFLNLLWLYWEQFIKLSISFFVSVWFIRYMGPTNMGKFSFIISLIVGLSPLISLGGDDVGVKYITDNKSEHPVEDLIAVRLLGAVLLVLISLLTTVVLGKSSVIIVGVLIYSLFFVFRSLDSLNEHFQIKMAMKKVVLIRNIAFIISSALKVTAILLKMHWTVFVILAGVEVMLFCLSSFLAYKREGLRLNFSKIELSRTLSFFKVIWPIISLYFLLQLIVKVDHIMISYFLGDHALGVYSSAIKLVDLVNFVPLAYLSVVYPKILQINKLEGTVNSLRYVRKNELLILGLGLTIALIVSFFTEGITMILFGEKFIGSAPVLRVFLFQIVFYFLFLLEMKYLIVRNKERWAFISVLALFGVNFTLNLFLIPRYGTIGAAYTSVISFVVGTTAVFLLSKFVLRRVSVH